MTSISEQLDGAIVRGFDMGFAPWMRRRIRLCVAPLPQRIPADGPLLLVANHVRWWDGFVLRDVQRMLGRRGKLHTVSAEREVSAHPFLRRLGAIALDSSSPGSIRHALRTLASTRERTPDAVFAYFPQGRIVPSHVRPLDFRRGVDLAIRALAPITVLPTALHYEPLTRVAPTAFVSVGTPVRAPMSGLTHARLENEITQLLDEMLAFIAANGEHADDAWVRDGAPARPRLLSQAAG